MTTPKTMQKGRSNGGENGKSAGHNTSAADLNTPQNICIYSIMLSLKDCWLLTLVIVLVPMSVFFNLFRAGNGRWHLEYLWHLRVTFFPRRVCLLQSGVASGCGIFWPFIASSTKYKTVKVLRAKYTAKLTGHQYQVYDSRLFKGATYEETL